MSSFLFQVALLEMLAFDCWNLDDASGESSAYEP